MSRSRDDPFRVPWLTDALGAWVASCPDFFVGLGRLETGSLETELRRVPALRPVYVCGLARSGTTVLHHALASAPGVATLRARDYPFVHTPVWSRRATAGQKGEARERAHGDRVRVGPDTPEALEEMLWLAFFPRCHEAGIVQDAKTRHPAFESYYRDHHRKLMLAEGARRTAVKANYHLARIGFLHRMFPEARFVLPLRDPVDHIASLMRQHERFSAGERRHPAALRQMRRSGHFEFGLDCRPMALGDTSEIEQEWRRGGVRGWALYWAMVHDWLASRLESEEWASACLVVSYEELCSRPAEVLDEVSRHCGLEIPASAAAGMSAPEHPARFSSAEREEIEQATREAHQRLHALGRR